MIRHEFDIYVELYKRGEYDSIPIGEYSKGEYFYCTEKQVRTLKLLSDNETVNIGYGGSARSGKSVIETTAIIMDCLAYSGIAWGLARKELTVLKRTVLLTLFKQLSFYGLQKDVDYNYNQQLNKITFTNGSEIFLIDTAYQPSDPLLTRFGGFELTRCAVDESNETEAAVIEKLFERTGWRLNDKYGLKRKLFECFNPAKNHVYFRFYIPFKDNRESAHSKFVVALPSDNPHPSVQEWIEDMIKTSDEVTVQRQVYGNFEYDDDPAALCNYKNILNLFTNDHAATGEKRISADLAMQGRDKFIAGYWDGNVVTVDIDKGKCTGKEIEVDLREMKIKRGVANTNIIADSDGLGAYLESYIENIITFHGGQRANEIEFFNIKSQCAFKLAEKINNHEIKIICSDAQKDAIMAEIAVCLKRENLDADSSKKKLMGKEEMKKRLGRSPDYLDMLIMGMWFHITECEKLYPKVVTVDALPKESEIKYSFTATPDESDNSFCTLFMQIILGKIYVYDAVYSHSQGNDASVSIGDKVKETNTLMNRVKINQHGGAFISLLQQQGVNVTGYVDTGGLNQLLSSYSYLIDKVYFLNPFIEGTSEDYAKAMHHIQNYPKDEKREDGQNKPESAITELLRFFQVNNPELLRGEM